jgi:hypothetical protein
LSTILVETILVETSLVAHCHKVSSFVAIRYTGDYKIMTIRPALVVFLLVGTLRSPAQNRQTDSQTLQEIFGELKAIHEDMRATESTQILIAELEMQQGVVNRATENLDQARERLSDVQRDLKMAGADLAMAQNHLDQISNPDERKHIADDYDRLKMNMTTLKEEEQRRAMTQQDMQQRLKAAEDRLDDIESN